MPQNVIWMTESQESFLGGSSASHPSQDNFRGGSDAGGGIDSAAFLQQECGDSDVLIATIESSLAILQISMDRIMTAIMTIMITMTMTISLREMTMVTEKNGLCWSFATSSGTAIKMTKLQ